MPLSCLDVPYLSASVDKVAESGAFPSRRIMYTDQNVESKLKGLAALNRFGRRDRQNAGAWNVTTVQ